MKHSEQIDQIGPAMLRAKALISALPLVKDARGDKAKYLQLGTLNAALEPILLNEEMMHLSGTTDKIADGLLIAITVETVLLHTPSGQWFSMEVIIPVSGPLLKGGLERGPVGAQDGGISLTYGRRYGIFAFWNLAVDEDTDGAARNQGRRAKARELAVDVATKTNERTTALREKLEAKRAEKPAPEPLLVTAEYCHLCQRSQGQPHEATCPNAQPDPKSGKAGRARPAAKPSGGDS